LPESVLLTVEDGIAVVTLSRPERRNALSLSLLGDLARVFGAAGVTAWRAVVLEGSAGCFSAGADLTELAGTADDVAMDNAIAEAARALRDTPVPVVAAIEGPCLGAAVELALACDVRIASQTAYFEIPAVRLGTLYRPQAYAEMARILPPDTLVRLALLGDRLGAREASRAHLVSMVAPPGLARPEALRRLARLPGPGWPAVGATKRLLRDIALGTFEAASWEQRRVELLSSPERRSALAAHRARTGGAASGRPPGGGALR
jgi:enoyl-CoA hydratase